MNSKGRCLASRIGFTLIEMVIVMLVMSILASVAVPTYVSALANYRVEMAAKQIVADLHYAKSEALRRSMSRTVLFDSANNAYTLVDVADPDRPARGFVVSLRDAPFSAQLISALFEGDETVVFDMFGRPDSVGTVVLESGGTQRTVILAADGTATVQ